MKRIAEYIFVFLLLFFISCSQDKGNYDYVDLNEPSVATLEDHSVLMFSRLKVSPVIANVTSDSDRYSYQWKAVNDNGMTEPVIIGEERDLDYEVTLSPGSYTVFFTVTETSSGIYWSHEMNLTVSSSTSEGWMVSSEPKGLTSSIQTSGKTW